jgi:NitT/TauT family transport system substrate-binding protein
MRENFIRLRASLALLSALALSPAAQAADHLRLTVLAGGTFAWELAVVKAYGLDVKADLALDVTELASTEAAKIALIGGGADMILSDWLWAARERGLGHKLVFYPQSSTLGAVMAKAGAKLNSPADFVGKKLGVAGGPLDKSWLMLQAWALGQGVDLKANSTVIFGAPPLLAEKLGQGEVDAVLEFWTYCAMLEGRGFARAIDMADVEHQLGAKGPISVGGYVFDESFAIAHKDALERFLDITRKAKYMIAGDDEAFGKVAPLIDAKAPATLAIYRRRYAEGIPTRSIGAEEADAAAIYQVLAKLGGAELVGSAPTLDPGVFYRGPAGNDAPHDNVVAIPNAAVNPNSAANP